MQRLFLMALGLMFAILAASSAIAASDKVMSTEVVNLTATIESIDQAKRLLTLKNDAGELMTFEVTAEVKRFGELRRGDKVRVQAYRAVAVEMSRHGRVGKQVTDEVKRAGPKDKPAIAVRRDVKATVTVNEVDTTKNLVSISGTSGLTAVLEVKKPEMQHFIKQLKRGDKLDVTYTDAVAVFVESIAK